MTPLIWWKQRLQEGHPLGSPFLRTVTNLKYQHGMDRGWPRYVAKQALYDDYLYWHENTYLAPYKNSGYFVDQNRIKPKEAELASPFFQCIYRYVALEKQPRTPFFVRISVHYMGKYHYFKVPRNFYRLSPLDDHRHEYALRQGWNTTSPLTALSWHV